MSSIDPATRAQSPPDPARSRRRSGRGGRPRPDRRRFRLAGLAALASLGLVLGAGGLAVLTRPEPAVGPPLVITVSGTELWNETIDRPIEIAANNVSLHGVTVRTGGPAAIRIRHGVEGFFAENTDIRCRTDHTDGIVPGNYSALRVRAHGCRNAFVRSDLEPATVMESQRDGRPYSTNRASAPARAPGPLDRMPSGANPAGPGAPPGVLATPPTPITYWPGPTTTGVPAGTTLRNSGSLSLRTAGQVVSGLNITGCVSVFASNVTIQRSRITCSIPTYSVRVYSPATNVIVQDVEINGTGQTSATVCCGNYTIRRANIYNTIDGPRLGDNSTIADSWVHDLARIPDSHNDALQTTAGVNIVIRHNRLEPYNAPLRDPMNACIMIGSTTGPTVTNLLMEDNYCNGGNYSIGIRKDLVSSLINIRGNKFGRDYRYGIVVNVRLLGINWDPVTNVWFDNGRPVPFS
ncbi:hypothetical protein AB0J86_36025 [Micromonospora sp. NPDC049559]|uniref:hypothetical protein n=1 Tax=Micromonospora sp. NPDC049559 TaxID=3155923 RepID=UPI00342B9756